MSEAILVPLLILATLTGYLGVAAVMFRFTVGGVIERKRKDALSHPYPIYDDELDWTEKWRAFSARDHAWVCLAWPMTLPSVLITRYVDGAAVKADPREPELRAARLAARVAELEAEVLGEPEPDPHPAEYGLDGKYGESRRDELVRKLTAVIERTRTNRRNRRR